MRIWKKTTHFQELRHTCKEDGALSRITARLREKTPHLRERCRTCEKDGTLLGLRRTRHYCGASNKVRHTRLGEKRHTLCHIFKCGCSAFVAFFLTHVRMRFKKTPLNYVTDMQVTTYSCRYTPLPAPHSLSVLLW